MSFRTVEKIGGTSMSDYEAVRDNVILKPVDEKYFYQRAFVVSAYGGITDRLLENKKNGRPGVYGSFSNGIENEEWLSCLAKLKDRILDINQSLFQEKELLEQANNFIIERLVEAKRCLTDLQRLCQHGHFELETHLNTVREMLASIGEAHSAWNMTHLLRRDGIDAHFVDLTGWESEQHIPLDELIETVLLNIDIEEKLPIITGYAHCKEGLMSSFDRGYSEITFSRIAVLAKASEAIIHKEFHLSSADPKLVFEQNVVPIGRTNYDVADQLANLGMEAIHPKAAKGLKQNDIPLRVKNAFEPEHTGTLITSDYVSSKSCVEIIAGCREVYAIEIFDQDMTTDINSYDQEILRTIHRFKAHIISKDINANTVTHYLKTNLKTVKRICHTLKEVFPEAEINQQKIAIVSAVGSDMQVPGLLGKTVNALADSKISVLAVHQSMRQVDMQFIVNIDDYEEAVRNLHYSLVEVHDHGKAICLAS